MPQPLPAAGPLFVLRACPPATKRSDSRSALRPVPTKRCPNVASLSAPPRICRIRLRTWLVRCGMCSRSQVSNICAIPAGRFLLVRRGRFASRRGRHFLGTHALWQPRGIEQQAHIVTPRVRQCRRPRHRNRARRAPSHRHPSKPTDRPSPPSNRWIWPSRSARPSSSRSDCAFGARLRCRPGVRRATAAALAAESPRPSTAWVYLVVQPLTGLWYHIDDHKSGAARLAPCLGDELNSMFACRQLEVEAPLIGRPLTGVRRVGGARGLPGCRRHRSSGGPDPTRALQSESADRVCRDGLWLEERPLAPVAEIRDVTRRRPCSPRPGPDKPLSGNNR